MNMSKNLFNLIVSDLKAAKKRDPAARNYLEIFFTYSGFHATFIHRLCNLFWRIGFKFLARFLSNLSRIFTSIEIHPAAKIDSGFFIDHGAGLVIGETSVIGKNVTIYQQATLGGITPSVDSESQRNIKRHPTIKDNVIVGSGAQILGPIVIGENSRIGANAVVLKDVPENITYVGVPARKIETKNFKDTFNAYGISEGKIDDPNKKSIHVLFKEIHFLSEKIEKLKEELYKNTDFKNAYRIENSKKKQSRRK